ncbi:hypothetical protein EYF80_007529 [Liparis tanakae]|uniref:Uncharacterized protein n=1 Tax=Liparis tanakae TaxID=230148 RepID=A0A4Z2IWM4_9TELE|nr:hypothetical protein EYF80_007529 [Liparis tanakae]
MTFLKGGLPNNAVESTSKWAWAYGMLPLSNQQSNTSEILRSTPFPQRDGMVRLSMLGRARELGLQLCDDTLEAVHLIHVGHLHVLQLLLQGSVASLHAVNLVLQL